MGEDMHAQREAPYTKNTLIELLDAPEHEQTLLLKSLNKMLDDLTAAERLKWAFECLPDTHALSSSFGIQAAVMLHLATQIQPDIPVILTDTGYLFPETYRFIDTLTTQLQLNLSTFRAETSSVWQEARYGQLWSQGEAGLALYNKINKVEPMQRALAQLGVGTWFAGLRRDQAKSRENLPILAIHGKRYKLLPIIDWNNKQVHDYLQLHQLPYHPLWYDNYVSVGDSHSSKPLEPGMLEEETRFNGIKRECGLHYEI
ncbi:phosphoadenylyl-sulfate reductase [Parashewanella spongiae]|nr:phosphoadenylyl-sulfate reductase [Parashewanella spongiae]MCL1077433.1 phosphoadenylyl-sulfate reductase [Parashewanella spongiae]